jgi:hypothetical protein
MFGHFSSLEFPEMAITYDRFAALQSLTPELGGWLLLHACLDREGVALSMAANVAGIASLCLEPESSLAKQALRAGVCDFLVNDLDEALRILKNEIRKGRSVSVVVTGEPELVVAEAVERGLQPDIVHLQLDGRDIPGIDTLIARGARRLSLKRPSEDMIAVTWSVAREPLRWLPLADARAADALDLRERSTPQRKRWIEGSPRYLGRLFAAQRFLRMTPAEADAFFAAVQRDVEGGEIQVAVSVVRNGEEELVLS